MFAVIAQGHWKPGIGDPTVGGWAITIGYLIAFGLCGAYALRVRKVFPPVRFNWHGAFWWGLAVFMLLMGLNKQLDLQVLFLSIGRHISKMQGWYAERREVRKWFVLSIAFVTLILMLWLGWLCRRVWRRYILPIVGIMLLVFFVFIRACAGRVVILGHRPGEIPMYWIFEVGGIVCIGASALIGLRHSRRKVD